MSAEPLRVLDLFSGIGGMSLGLERAGGFVTAAFCENATFQRGRLTERWPGVPVYGDVRDLSHTRLAADGLGGLSVVAGGFPCQDLSAAGFGAGLQGARSGLWREMHRIIGEVRPRWVIIENVPLLRARGLDRVLGGLDALGYDAEWHCIPASHVGAPHLRDRIWVVAYPQGFGRGAWRERGLVDGLAGLPHPPCWDASLGPVAHFEARCDEPALLGVDDGVSDWVDRVFALGNSLHPAIPELIGRAIMAAEAEDGP